LDLSGVRWQSGGADPSGEDPAAEVAGRLRDAQVVKANVRRTVYRATAGSRTFFVKHDHPRGLRNRIKGLWRCKAEKEFRSGRRLGAAGVPVVRLLAWGRRGADSYLLSEELCGAAGFAEAWAECRGDGQRRAAFLRGLTGFLAAMLKANVEHPDLHAGNVLVTWEPCGAGSATPGGLRDGEAGGAGVRAGFHLVDVYGVRVRRTLARRQVEGVLGLAFGLGRELAPAEGGAILSALGVASGPPDAAAAAAAWQRGVHAFLRRRSPAWPGRRRRLLEASSLCACRRTAAGTWRVRRPFTLEAAQAAVGQHDANLAAGHNVVKQDVKRRLTRVVVAGQSYVVKEYVRVRAWPACARPDRAAWLNSYRLAMAGVPCCGSLGWLQAAGGRGFVVLEDLGPQTLLQRVADGVTAEERAQLLAAAGRLVGWLHGAGVVAGDLKPTNVMVVPESEPGPGGCGWRLALVDVDRIRFCHGGVSLARRVRGLRQLAAPLQAILPQGACGPLVEFYLNALAPGRREEQRLRDALAGLGE